MIKLFNNYIKWIGVESEGFRRILILIHSLTYFLILFSSELNDFINGMGLISENKNFYEFILGLTIPLFITIIFIGIPTKIFSWIRDGFNKK